MGPQLSYIKVCNNPYLFSPLAYILLNKFLYLVVHFSYLQHLRCQGFKKIFQLKYVSIVGCHHRFSCLKHRSDTVFKG